MKKYLITILVLIIIILDIIFIYHKYNEENKNVIKDNYIAVFKGETTDKVYKTYLYKKKKGKKKYKYINTESYLSGYDNTTWEEKIIKKKDFKKLNDIFEIAEKNNASQQAKFQNDDAIYTFEEFKELLKKEIK